MGVEPELAFYVRHPEPHDLLDSLDMGLVAALNQTFYETYGEETQPERATVEAGGHGVLLPDDGPAGGVEGDDASP